MLRKRLFLGSKSWIVPITSLSIWSGTISTEVIGQVGDSGQLYRSLPPAAKMTLFSAIAAIVKGDAMGLPGMWWSEPWPIKASIFSLSVMATEPTPVSLWMIFANATADSPLMPLARMFSVRSAILNAFAEETAAIRSTMFFWSRMMLMNSAAPAAFDRIIGTAMIDTRVTALA